MLTCDKCRRQSASLKDGLCFSCSMLDAEPVEEPDLRGPTIIAEGSVLSGFKFTGPFDTVDAACKWHKKNSLPGLLGQTVSVCLLLTPESQQISEEQPPIIVDEPSDRESLVRKFEVALYQRGVIREVPDSRVRDAVLEVIDEQQP